MTDIIISKEKFSCKYWTLCLLLIIPFSMYSAGLPSIRLPELLMFFGIVLFYFVKKGKVLISYDLNLFLQMMIVLFLLSVVSSVVRMDLQPVFILRYLRLVLYVLFIVIAYTMIDKPVLLKLLRIITVVSASYVILQYLTYHVFGIVLPNNLLPLPVSRETMEEVSTSFEKYYFRAYGFFTEPSYFAKFIVPGFAYSLYGWNQKKVDYFSCILIAVAVFCSTSLQGIVFIIFMILFRGSYLLHNKHIPVVVIRRVLLFLFLLLFFLWVFSQYKGWDYILLRFDKLLAFDFRSGGSMSLRLLRGYYVYDQLPWVFQIIGLGFGGIADYIIANNIYTPYDASIYSNATVAGYVNGISYILITGGGIGFIVFAYCYLKIYNYSNTVNKIILLTYLLMLFSGGGIFTITMCYFLGIVFIGNKHSVAIR